MIEMRKVCILFFAILSGLDLKIRGKRPLGKNRVFVIYSDKCLPMTPLWLALQGSFFSFLGI